MSYHSMSISNPQDLSNTIWAAATLDIPPPATWMELFEIESRGRLSAFTSQGLGNMIWGFAKLRHSPSNEWLQTFVVASLANIPNFNAQDMSNIVWALAELDVNPGSEWMEAWTKRLMILLNVLSEQVTANALWALTVLQEYRNTAFLMLWSRSQQLLTPASDVRGLHNIYCVYKASTAEMPELLPEPDATNFDAARDAWRNNTADRAKQDASNIAAAVAACLRNMSIVHKIEYLWFASERSIDIALPDRRIAIEVDGPSHYLGNTRKPSGTTQLRDRVLKRAGWAVVSVPWFEWVELSSTQAQMDYLQRKLATCK